MLHPEWLDETWVTCGWRLSVRCSFVKSAGSYRWSRKSIITIWGRYTAKWIQIIYVTLYSLPVPSLLRKPLGLENAAWKFEFCSFLKFTQKSAKYHKIAANIRFKKKQPNIYPRTNTSEEITLMPKPFSILLWGLDSIKAHTNIVLVSISMVPCRMGVNSEWSHTL